MARRRHTSEIVRMLVRNLAHRHTDDVSVIVAELREYAVTRRFMDGQPMSEAAFHWRLGNAWDTARTEQAVRNIHKRGWR